VDGRIRGLGLLYGTSTSLVSTGATGNRGKQNSLLSLQMDTPNHTSEASPIELTRSLNGSEIAVTLWLRTRRGTTFQSRSRPTPVSILSSRLTACLPAQSFDRRSAFKQATATLPCDDAKYQQRFNCYVYKQMR